MTLPCRVSHRACAQAGTLRITEWDTHLILIMPAAQSPWLTLGAREETLRERGYITCAAYLRQIGEQGRLFCKVGFCVGFVCLANVPELVRRLNYEIIWVKVKNVCNCINVPLSVFKPTGFPKLNKAVLGIVFKLGLFRLSI